MELKMSITWLCRDTLLVLHPWGETLGSDARFHNILGNPGLLDFVRTGEHGRRCSSENPRVCSSYGGSHFCGHWVGSAIALICHWVIHRWTWAVDNDEMNWSRGQEAVLTFRCSVARLTVYDKVRSLEIQRVLTIAMLLLWTDRDQLRQFGHLTRKSYQLLREVFLAGPNGQRSSGGPRIHERLSSKTWDLP